MPQASYIVCYKSMPVSTRAKHTRVPGVSLSLYIYLYV